MTDGERWTREQLRLLRDARFSPRALTRFLAASQRRANGVRASRPALARQEAAWIATGAAGWTLAPFRVHARVGLVWWAACAIMLDWHLGMCETLDGQARALGAADALTTLRAWMAPLAAAGPSVGLYLVAGATDVLDGALARRSMPTRIGRDFDGLADFCFATAALRGAQRADAIARASAGAELARQGAGLAYALWIYLGHAQAPDRAITEAARLVAPARTAGLIAAGLGRRRAADALILGSCGVSVGALACALARGWSSSKRR